MSLEAKDKFDLESLPLEVFCRLFERITYQELVGVFRKLPQYIHELTECVKEIDFTEGQYLVDSNYQIIYQGNSDVHPKTIIDTKTKFPRVRTYYAITSDMFSDEPTDLLPKIISDPDAKELYVIIGRESENDYSIITSLFTGLERRLARYKNNFILIITHPLYTFKYIKGVLGIELSDYDEYIIDGNVIQRLREIFVIDYPGSVEATLNFENYIPCDKTYTQRIRNTMPLAFFSEIYYIGDDPYNESLKYEDIEEINYGYSEDNPINKLKVFKFPIDLSAEIQDDEGRYMYSPDTIIDVFLKKFPNVKKIYPVEYFLPKSREITSEYEDLLAMSSKYTGLIALPGED